VVQGTTPAECEDVDGVSPHGCVAAAQWAVAASSSGRGCAGVTLTPGGGAREASPPPRDARCCCCPAITSACHGAQPASEAERVHQHAGTSCAARQRVVPHCVRYRGVASTTRSQKPPTPDVQSLTCLLVGEVALTCRPRRCQVARRGARNPPNHLSDASNRHSETAVQSARVNAMQRVMMNACNHSVRAGSSGAVDGGLPDVIVWAAGRRGHEVWRVTNHSCSVLGNRPTKEGAGACMGRCRVPDALNHSSRLGWCCAVATGPSACRRAAPRTCTQHTPCMLWSCVAGAGTIPVRHVCHTRCVRMRMQQTQRPPPASCPCCPDNSLLRIVLLATHVFVVIAIIS
jgi:hypothetical protein